MVKKLKHIISVIVLALVFFNSYVPVSYADGVNGNGSSFSSAQMILANEETPAQIAKGSLVGRHSVKGSVSLNEEDWYYVNLSSGQNYLTSYDGERVSYYVYDSSATSLITSYAYDSNTRRGHVFNVPQDGKYYVKVLGVSEKSSSYTFTIGGPSYKLETRTFSSQNGTFTMNRGVSTTSVRMLADKNVAEGAIATSVYLSGVTSKHHMTNISVRSLMDQKTFTLRKYTYDNSSLIEKNISCEQGFMMTFTRSDTTNSVNITPSLKVVYIYPVK